MPVLDYAGGQVSPSSLRAGYGFGASSLFAGNGYGHWTFDSGSLRTLLQGLFDLNAVGKSADHVAGPSALRIDGVKVSLYRVAPGTSGYANHVAMVWRAGSQAFMVTVHRWSGDRLAVAQARAMAAGLIGQLARR